jgi:hypothetical protein
MLEAANADLVFTISLKRSTLNLLLSTNSPADYPIFTPNSVMKADITRLPLPAGRVTVRRSRPTPCRQPEHRSHQTRSAAAASFARCIIVNSYYRQSGGAGSGGLPDKAGANCKEKRELFGLVLVQVRRTPVVPLNLFFLIEN